MRVTALFKLIATALLSLLDGLDWILPLDLAAGVTVIPLVAKISATGLGGSFGSSCGTIVCPSLPRTLSVIESVS